MISSLLIVGCIIVNGCIQKETASGIVTAGIMDNITPLSTVVPLVVITPMPENNNQPNGTPSAPPFYFTSKNISYEDMKMWEKNFTQPSPIPESEMARIIFSKTWFIQNDTDPRQDEVQITFPGTWLDKSPANDNEPVILLQIPKRELELINSNSDPKMVTIIYRAERFSEFPNMTAVPAFSTVSPIIILSPQESDMRNNGTSQKLPDFMPGIDDKMSYEEEKQLIKNSTQSQPVPESEMANIIFSKTWFVLNDKDPRPDEALLTFPAKWVDSPAVNDNEEIVLLRVPKKMLGLDDSNPDPEMITVIYPKTSFKEFANRNAINITSHT